MRYFIDLIKDLTAGRIAPVYLFYGPEDYLRRAAARKIKELLLPGEAGDFDCTSLDGESVSPAEIASLSSMAPFLAARRLVLVNGTRLFSGRKGTPESPGGEAGEEAAGAVRAEEAPLLKYLAAPNPYTCLVLDAGEQVDRRKKIFKEIAKTGKVVEFSTLKTGDLTAWLEKKARQAGKSLAPGVSAQILARVGSSLQALSPEIQKLILYTGENTVITAEDVAAVTPASLEEDIFAVVDALGEGNPARAIAGVTRLVRQKQAPPAILGMVARQIRLILRTGEALGSGVSQAELPARLGIHPFVAKKMASQQRNFNRRQLITSLHRLHELDTAVKSGRQEFLPGMEMFILDACRKSSSKR